MLAIGCHDAAGNIVELKDGAQQTLYFDNHRISPDRKYEYDALHRLTKAEGRCLQATRPTAAAPPAVQGIPMPSDPNAPAAYAQTYAYDAVGNILEMHQTQGGTTAWRRRYQYALTSNRLVSTSAPADGIKADYVDPAAPASSQYTDTYSHDAHGSITAMPGLLGHAWNDSDELQEVDLGGGGHAYYVYSGGQRVRKLIRRQNGTDVVERIYLGGWELYRRHQTSTGVASSIPGLSKTERLKPSM